MELLYNLTDTRDEIKKELYIKRNIYRENNNFLKGDIWDFFTYFNAFSIKKWKRYTTIKKVRINMEFQGEVEVTIHLKGLHNNGVLIKEICSNGYSGTFNMEQLNGDILGISIKAISEYVLYFGGAYYGEFDKWKDISIGIGICTFKREQYVLRTLNTILQIKKRCSWLKVLIVDNGNTLPERDDDVRIVHNLNYGGSGGFTRVLIEYVKGDSVDYILLMDDDIVLDSHVLVRTHSFLCGLKNNYRKSFLSGAMLNLERPNVQYENTAYWGRVRLHGFGNNLDMRKQRNLIINEYFQTVKNQYGAWWYCCIPITRVRKIGYPLPIFIKGDDMEYGIRNCQPVLSLNGIAVWHQSFSTKVNPVVNYYSDRNMLIINHFADGCNIVTFAIAVIGRIIKRSFKFNLIGLQMLYLALKDYQSGLDGITAIGADEKMKQVQQYSKERKSFSIILNLLKYAIKTILLYPSTHQKYKDFREQKLKTPEFWIKYLRIGED